MQVAEYSVDSLKQLALKFMYKEELRDFNFQRLFLCPFESVFVATKHQEIKVLILDCVQNLVQVGRRNECETTATSHGFRVGLACFFAVPSICVVLESPDTFGEAP